MTSENSMPKHDDLVASIVSEMCSRTLNHFAEEARMDGESLQQAVERYDIDYAWHVLGSDRMREETVSALEAQMQHAATDEQRACVTEILKSAAAVQAVDSLMSFDNDVPERLAGLLCASWSGRQTTVPEGAEVG